MNPKIRVAKKEDMPQVLALIQELATFEKAPNAVKIDVEDLEKDGFGKKPLFKCFVAEIKGKLQGMALIYFRYSTWTGKSVHLEDLIVRQEQRRKSIGSKLYKKVMEYALNQNVQRVEWVVLDWNQPAIDFYKKTGATVFDEWKTVQFEKEALQNFLAN